MDENVRTDIEYGLSVYNVCGILQCVRVCVCVGGREGGAGSYCICLVKCLSL